MGKGDGVAEGEGGVTTDIPGGEDDDTAAAPLMAGISLRYIIGDTRDEDRPELDQSGASGRSQSGAGGTRRPLAAEARNRTWRSNASL